MGSILIVEDEFVLARTIVTFLKRQGFSAYYATNASTARTIFLRESPSLSIVDYRLEHDDGLELLNWMREVRPDSRVVMMTGHGDIDLAVKAMKAGARDFLVKPVPLKSIADVARDLMLDESVNSEYAIGVHRLVGRSSAAVNLVKSVQKLSALSMVESPPGILIMGATGTGKSLVAQALHEEAQTRTGTFITYDCSMPEIIERDLLPSVIQQAESGTLLIRHIDTLPLEQQAVLLQLLQDSKGKINPPWLLSTTKNHQLGDSRYNDFRADLLYKIQVGWIEIPSLADRTADILPIADSLARNFALKYRLSRPNFTADARIKLLEHRWPGNVAELKNCLEQATVNALNGTIDASDLRMMGEHGKPSTVPKLNQVEEQTLEHALSAANGNISKAARLLGISRDKMRYRMGKLGLSRR